MSTQSKAAFLKWIRRNQPALYKAAMERQGGNLGALSDTINKVFSTVTDTISKLGTAYVQGRAALELTKANIKRAKQGLEPVNSLDELQYGSGSYGSSGINIGGMTISPLMLAAIGIGAFLILRRR